ncbi:MAG TPA: hypothetical protein DCS93_18640 [Microscillaceae bacterium]|nr:hypothetical protein [Microscillaceae bacterium]
MKKCFFKLFNVIIVSNLLLQTQAMPQTSSLNIKNHQIPVGNLTNNTPQGPLPGKNLLLIHNPLAQADGELKEGPSKPTKPHSRQAKQGSGLKLQVTKQSSVSPNASPSFYTVEPNDIIQASYKESIIGFRFTPDKHHLQSSSVGPKPMAKGLDAGLHYTNAASPINYFDLPPGIHEFRVALQSEPGLKDEKEFRWTVVIQTPWWQTWWFYLSIVGIFILGYYLNRRAKRAKLKLTQDSTNMLLPVDGQVSDEKALTQPMSDSQTLKESEVTAQLKEKLYEFVVIQQLYKEEDISLANLAQKMKISERRLSELFNRELQTSFYDYINHCRVNAFKERIKQGGVDHLKLIAIAYDSGFRSKATFNRIFKKYTGLTPSQYRKMIEESSDD